MRKFDVLIIGSGLAGQSAALRLAPHCRVALVSKRSLEDSASGWAQGGIAAVLDSRDSIEAHIRDTLIAGAWLNDPAATRFVVENGRHAIEWLIEQGVPFTRDESGYHLTREGGHSARRVIHVADATGAAVQETLTQQVRNNPNITILEHHIAIDLITGDKLGSAESRCYGAYVLDSGNGQVITIGAASTLIATGGAGKVYLYTTNPDTATGDGIAMAWRAGCRVANMEFIQFHPTCLYHPQAKSFLISEAVRGEGGLLRRPDGTRFMPRHDARGELAPRDIVARAIDFEMKKRGLDCVYLDITHKPARTSSATHFPNIHARCLELGIDITREPIPVVPAAHYTCGGVVTDLRGAHRPTWPLCRRRSRLHRPARRQPPGQQFAARMPGLGGGRGERHPGQPIARSRPIFPAGTKAASPTPTRKSSSRTTGTNCAASCGTTSASCAPTSASSAPCIASVC